MERCGPFMGRACVAHLAPGHKRCISRLLSTWRLRRRYSGGYRTPPTDRMIQIAAQKAARPTAQPASCRGIRKTPRSLRRIRTARSRTFGGPSSRSGTSSGSGGGGPFPLGGSASSGSRRRSSASSRARCSSARVRPPDRSARLRPRSAAPPAASAPRPARSGATPRPPAPPALRARPTRRARPGDRRARGGR